MHVAVCDDNVADRKHLERLLSRESDKRSGTPNILYIESFGDKEHFLKNPLKYNIVFMDMCSREGLVKEIIGRLDEMGFNAPLVLYSSKYDYTALKNLPPYVIHAKKPYIPDPLPEFLALGDKNVLGNVVTLPVHINGVVQPVPKDQLMYAVPSDNPNASGKYTLFISGGTALETDDDISAIRQILEPHDEFKLINKDCFVNFKYVSIVMPFTIMMLDYRAFRISLFNSRKFKMHKASIDSTMT